MHLDDPQMKTNGEHKVMEATEKEKEERAGETEKETNKRERQREKDYYNVFMPPTSPWGKSTLESPTRTKETLLVMTPSLLGILVQPVCFSVFVMIACRALARATHICR